MNKKLNEIQKIMETHKNEILKDMKLSIVIPVYNEEKTLRSVYQSLTQVDFRVNEVEIIFVDDCSKDHSKTIIEDLAKNDPRIRYFFKEKNEGKGSALQMGIQNTSGDIIIVQDADLEYNPEDMVPLVQLIINNKADVVYGSRFSSMSSQVCRFYHYLGNKILTVFSNFFSDIRLTDMETCYKCFRAEIIKNIIITSKTINDRLSVQRTIIRHIKIH